MNTILVVDDEDALLDILADVLKAEGYGVVTAANGRDGLARAETDKPDLILTDFMMPLAGGHQLIRAARALPGMAALPAIVMSASQPGTAFPPWIAASGPSAFLHKPFHLDELLATIEHLIGKATPALH